LENTIVIESIARDGSSSEPDDRRIYGVAPATVINNLDPTSQARVQIQIPWLPGYEPWARLAVLMAGMGRGTFFVPQIGDEVLVAFSHGDIREPYVIGCLWNGTDRPPALLPTDPVNKRVIRTTVGHEIEFDDLLQKITITSSTQQVIEIDPLEIKISTTAGTASISLDAAGSMTLQAAVSLTLKAPQLKIEGGVLDLKGAASATLNGGAACNIQGALVKIN
jgi:uncharacterized protein involved in type VI secretion and phage assembly